MNGKINLKKNKIMLLKFGWERVVRPFNSPNQLVESECLINLRQCLGGKELICHKFIIYYLI